MNAKAKMKAMMAKHDAPIPRAQRKSSVPQYALDKFVSMMPSACAPSILIKNDEMATGPLAPARYMTMRTKVVPVSFTVIRVSPSGILVMASGPEREDIAHFTISARDAMAAASAGVGEVQEVVMKMAEPAIKYITDNHKVFMLLEGKGND